MFCPDCGSEYRPGIVTCATCGVPLLERPHAPARSKGGGRVAERDDEPLVTFCGFLDLAEARHARDLVRREGVRADIVIREAPESDLREPAREEYWLRVPAKGFERATTILGYDDSAGAESADDEPFACSACGERVSADATACPRCGERFDD